MVQAKAHPIRLAYGLYIKGCYTENITLLFVQMELDLWQIEIRIMIQA
jgi:hypothetical protein